jgi:3-dehydroquinate synthetase
VGEIVKYAALSAEIFDMLKNNADKLDDLQFLTSLIVACVRHKAGVVERDEKETGERKSLNVGHTTGHALELFYSLSHGESVLFGMWIETKIAIEKGVCEKAYGEELLKIIKTALLLAPVSKPDFTKVDSATKFAKADKKNTGNNQIVMAVAKQKGVWALLSLPFEEYENSVIRIAKEL